MWVCVCANEPVFNQRRKKKKEKKKNISYVIGVLAKNWLFTGTTWQLHWPIADSSAFSFFAPARADGLGDYWVSGGRQIEAYQSADVSLHRCCHWEDTRAEEDGKKEKRPVLRLGTVYLLDVTRTEWFTRGRWPANGFLKLYRTGSWTGRAAVKLKKRSLLRLVFLMIVISVGVSFCQMIFSECCDLFEICIWMFSSAIWQSSESWPSVARSNASTSIWQWHLGKVFIFDSP